MTRRRLLTNAPAAYDYGGTFEIQHRSDGSRVVTVSETYVSYQIDRYLSGLYFVKEIK